MTRLIPALLVACCLLALVAAPASAQVPDDDPDAKKAKAMAAQIAPKVAEIRGLEWKFEVPTGVYTRDDIFEMIKEETEGMEAEMKKGSAILHKLGIVERDFDLHEAMMKLYGAGVAGFYDPDIKELNLVKNKEMSQEEQMQDMMMRAMLGVGQDEMVMAHELTHALDDQYYDLMNIVDQEKTTSDEDLVRLAVTEGTATSIQYDFLFARQGIKSYENPQIQSMLDEVPAEGAIPGADDANIPPMIIKQILWPYSVGNRLVFEARKREDGGWKTVNAMFEDLPASSEQVLHPEKYLDEPRDMPVVIELPEEEKLCAIFGEGWEELDRDTFGEFQMWTYFENFFQNRRSIGAVAKTTSAGWDGDTMVFVEKGENHEHVAMIWATIWDTQKDAIEFFRLYQNILQVKYEAQNAPAEAEEADVLYLFTDSDGTTVRLERRGNEVLVLESVPNGSVDKLVEACFKAERREWTRPPKGTNVPSRNPLGYKPITSRHWNGQRYANADAGLSFELPRDDHQLIQESDSAAVLRTPGEGAKAHWVLVQVFEQDAADFAEEMWGQFRRGLLRGFKETSIIKETAKDGVWKLVFGGTDHDGEHVVMVQCSEMNGQVVAVAVQAPKAEFNQAAMDLISILKTVKRADD